MTVSRCGAAPYLVRGEIGRIETISITVSGRDSWALGCLLTPGDNGCSPIPGRYAGYLLRYVVRRGMTGHRFCGSDDGLAVADAFSASNAINQPVEIARNWRSFIGSGVSFATLPAFARKFGADLSAIARKFKEASHG